MQGKVCAAFLASLWLACAPAQELEFGALALHPSGDSKVSIHFEPDLDGGALLVPDAGPGADAGDGDAAGPEADAGADARSDTAGWVLPPGDNLATSVHVALGIPIDSDPSDDYLIDREYWVASYNDARRIPNWVAWRVVPSDLGTAPRQDDFRADHLLPTEFYRVTQNDYRNSGYDRGHMCPSADRTSTVAANSATFLMTNMQPQAPALNRGVWAAFEDFTRTLVRQGKQVQVVSGGVFEPDTATTIGPGISLPTANFKVVVVLDLDQGPADVTMDTTVYSVIMPNSTTVTGTKWTQYLTSVDEVERRSGYDLLREVRNDIEAIIEAKVATAP
jgi:endonuclease G, mitochondrial